MMDEYQVQDIAATVKRDLEREIESVRSDLESRISRLEDANTDLRRALADVSRQLHDHKSYAYPGISHGCEG
jgi:BMFP domain-containing protein YqiC